MTEQEFLACIGKLEQIEANTRSLAVSMDRIANLAERWNLQNSPKTHVEMGFRENSPHPIRVFVNRIGNDCWYTLTEAGERVPVNYTCICGVIKGLEIKEIESENYGDRQKLDLTLMTDNSTYIIRSGKNTNFFKGLILGLSRMSPAQLRDPITITAEPGKKETVVLCRMYDCFGGAINTAWQEDYNWEEISSQVISFIAGESSFINTPSPQNLREENRIPDSTVIPTLQNEKPLRQGGLMGEECLKLRSVDGGSFPRQTSAPIKPPRETKSYSDHIKSVVRKTGHSVSELRAIASNVLGREIRTGHDIASDDECNLLEAELLNSYDDETW